MNAFTASSRASRSTDVQPLVPPLPRALKLDRHCTLARDPVMDTLALVLAGGRGARLAPLTDQQCKPAMAYGGKFRIIDFTLSNCANSGIQHVGVLTQYLSNTLISHLRKAWNFYNHDLSEFIELMPAQQREDAGWYEGTADAIYQNLDAIEDHGLRYVLVLAGDHVYKADYRRMIEYHRQSGADITVGSVEVASSSAHHYGILQCNDDGLITGFVEKPDAGDDLASTPGPVLASMGIYVFSRPFLVELLRKDASRQDSAHDFGHDILPRIIHDHRVMAYPFCSAQLDHYWRDVGTLDNYYQSNMELVDVQPELNLYDEQWPIRTYEPQLPPAKFIFDEPERRGSAWNSLVSSGCIVSGAQVRRSLLFSGARVEERSSIEASLLLPRARVGRYCQLRKAIIAEGVCIPDGMQIGLNLQADRERFHVTAAGVTVVCQHMLERLQGDSTNAVDHSATPADGEMAYSGPAPAPESLSR